jgi:hypothetical protein
MKKFRYFSLATAAICSGAGAPLASFADRSPPNAATVRESVARSTALGAVPKGVVQIGELKTEHARTAWSFNIGKPNSKDLVEVQVDARRGKIVSSKQTFG